jgi:hypothetical protein
MVSYDPQLWREAISQSQGVQSAGKLIEPGVIVDEEEAEFEIQPVQQPQFQAPAQQSAARSALGTIGSGIKRGFSELDRPISERLGFQIPEMRGPLDEIGNFVLREGSRTTNLLFALPGVGWGAGATARAAAVGARMAPKAARMGAALGRSQSQKAALSRVGDVVARNAPKFAVGATEPFGTFSGKLPYRIGMEALSGPIIAGAGRGAVEAIPEDAHWGIKLGVGLGAGLLGGGALAKTGTYLPSRFPGLVSQPALGQLWKTRQLANLSTDIESRPYIERSGNIEAIEKKYQEALERFRRTGKPEWELANGQPRPIRNNRQIELEIVERDTFDRSSDRYRSDPGSGVVPYRMTRKGNVQHTAPFVTAAEIRTSDEIPLLSNELDRINKRINELETEQTILETEPTFEQARDEAVLEAEEGIVSQRNIDAFNRNLEEQVITPEINREKAALAREILSSQGKSSEEIENYLKVVAEALAEKDYYDSNRVISLANKNLKIFKLENTDGDVVNIWSDTLEDIVEPSTARQRKVRDKFDEIIIDNPDQFNIRSKPLNIIDSKEFKDNFEETFSNEYNQDLKDVTDVLVDDFDYSSRRDGFTEGLDMTGMVDIELGNRWIKLLDALKLPRVFEFENIEQFKRAYFPTEKMQVKGPYGGGEIIFDPRYTLNTPVAENVIRKNPRLAIFEQDFITGKGFGTKQIIVPLRMFKEAGGGLDWTDPRNADNSRPKTRDAHERLKITKATRNVPKRIRDELMAMLEKDTARDYGVTEADEGGYISDSINAAIQNEKRIPSVPTRTQIDAESSIEDLQNALLVRSLSSKAESILKTKESIRTGLIDEFEELVFTGDELDRLLVVKDELTNLREEEAIALSRLMDFSADSDLETSPVARATLQEDAEGNVFVAEERDFDSQVDLLIPPTVSDELNAQSTAYQWRGSDGDYQGGFKIADGIMYEFWVKDPEMNRIGEDAFKAQQEANDMLVLAGKKTPAQTLPDDVYGVVGDALGGKALMKAIQELNVQVVQVPDGPVSILFQRLGFEETGRTSFKNSNNISATWDTQKYGKPDVITLAYTGGPRKGVLDGTGKLKGGIDSRVGATEFGETKSTRNEISSLEEAARTAKRVSELSDELYGSPGTRGPVRFADIFNDESAAAELGLLSREVDQNIVELDIDPADIQIDETLPARETQQQMLPPTAVEFIQRPFSAPDPDIVKSTAVNRKVAKNAEKFIDYNIGKLRAEGTNLYDVVTFKTVKKDKKGKFTSVSERYIVDPDTGDIVPEDIWVELGNQLDGFGRGMGRGVNTAARALAIQRMRVRTNKLIKDDDPSITNEILGNVLRGQFDPDAAEVALAYTEGRTAINSRAAWYKADVQRKLKKAGLYDSDNPEAGLIRPFMMRRFDNTEALSIGVNVKDGDQLTQEVITPDGEKIVTQIYDLNKIFTPEQLDVLDDVFGEIRVLRNAEIDQLSDAGLSVTGQVLARSQQAQQELMHYLPKEGMVNVFDLMENSNFVRTADGQVKLGQYVPRDVVFNPRVGASQGRGVIDSSHQQRRQTRFGPGFNENELQFNVEELLYNNASLDFQTDLPTLLTVRYKAGLDKLNAENLNNELKLVGKTAYDYIRESDPTLLGQFAGLSARLARLKDPKNIGEEEGEKRAVGKLFKQSDKVLKQMEDDVARILKEKDSWLRYSARDIKAITDEIVVSTRANGDIRQQLGKLMASKQAHLSEQRSLNRELQGLPNRLQQSRYRFEQSQPDYEDLWRMTFTGSPDAAPGMQREAYRFILGNKGWEELVGLNKVLEEIELKIIKEYNMILSEFAEWGLPVSDVMQRFDVKDIDSYNLGSVSRTALDRGGIVNDPRGLAGSDMSDTLNDIADADFSPSEQMAINSKILNKFVSLNQLYVKYIEKQKIVAERFDEINAKIDQNNIDQGYKKAASADMARIKKLIKQSNQMERSTGQAEVAGKLIRHAKRLEGANIHINETIKKYNESLVSKGKARYLEISALEEELAVLQDAINTKVQRFNGQLHLSDLSQLASTFQGSALRVPTNIAKELANTPGIQPSEQTTGALKLLADLNAEMRQVSATLDFSGTFIQGIFAMGTHPVEYAKSWMMVTKAVLGHPESLLKWMEDNQDLIDEFMQLSGVWTHPGGQEEFFLQAGTPALELATALTDKTALTRSIAKTLGKGRDLSNLHFSHLGNVNRILLYKKWREGKGIYKLTHGKEMPLSEQREVVKMINAATGYATDYKPGNIAQAALFAPRFFVSQLKMLQAAAFRDDAAGQYARSLMLTTIMTGVITTLSLNSVRGEETDFRPIKWSSQGEPYFNSNFLKIRNVGGRDVSMFGPYDSLAALLVTGMVEGPESMFTRGMRQKASPMMGNLYDSITGTDFQGNKVTWNVLNDTSGTIATAARMSQNSYTPFYVSDVAEDVLGQRLGVGSPAMLTGAFLGMKTAPLSIKERRDYEIVDWVRQLDPAIKEEIGLIYTNEDGVKVDITVEEWTDLTGEAKSLFSESFPEHDQERIDSLQRRANRGDVGATSQLNKEFIADTAYEEQQALADAFLRWRNNEPDPVLGYVVPVDISKILSEITNIRYRSWQAQQTQDAFFEREISNPAAEDPGQQAMSQYWDALESSSIPGTNEVVWPEFNNKIGALYNIWSPEQISYIENRSPARIHPVFQDAWDARMRINQSPYYVVADEIYRTENIQAILSRILGEENVPPYYELFVTMIEDLRADPDIQRQQYGALLSRINNRLSPMISSRRKLLLQQQPSLREDLVLIGRLQPQPTGQSMQAANFGPSVAMVGN